MPKYFLNLQILLQVIVSHCSESVLDESFFLKSKYVLSRCNLSYNELWITLRHCVLCNYVYPNLTCECLLKGLKVSVFVEAVVLIYIAGGEGKQSEVREAWNLDRCTCVCSCVNACERTFDEILEGVSFFSINIFFFDDLFLNGYVKNYLTDISMWMCVKDICDMKVWT